MDLKLAAGWTKLTSGLEDLQTGLVLWDKDSGNAKWSTQICIVVRIYTWLICQSTQSFKNKWSSSCK